MRIYRFAAKMAALAKISGGAGRPRQAQPPSATSAADAALGLRPRRALSSAQLPAEWTTTTLLRNDSSLNGTYPLNFVSHHMGAVHWLIPLPPPGSSQSIPVWRSFFNPGRLQGWLLAPSPPRAHTFLLLGH